MHAWFVNFGAVAMRRIFACSFLSRSLSSTPNNAPDRGNHMIMVVFAVVATAVVLVVSFVLVCLGVTATVPGWIGCALLGATLGLLRKS